LWDREKNANKEEIENRSEGEREEEEEGETMLWRSYIPFQQEMRYQSILD